ncbi:DUF5681 domain-containing protein [Oxalobacter vibrioformis]|uniref:DUF5681 domain-containing protein n=1 Tax=Oxalobacter vibrioformis TaxID=933080 RepID=A0A9E9P3G9_9BURK|nr:DUF5681 domain-containing protein [Oxalobacter vibrioformis]WAW10992.1 DUF5681 domain-containing protein [Oxalobacter vibrioformis]
MSENKNNEITAANSNETGGKLVVGRPFQPGQSGNPSGRPKKTGEELELITACKTKAPVALQVMETLMLNAKSEQVRLQAALAILDRGYGKPVQSHKLTEVSKQGMAPAHVVHIYIPDNGRD